MKVPIVLDIEREKGKEGEEDFMITNATAILSSGYLFLDSISIFLL